MSITENMTMLHEYVKQIHILSDEINDKPDKNIEEELSKINILIKFIKEIIREKININKKDVHGKTAFHYTYNKDIAEMLVHGGINPRLRDGDKNVAPCHFYFSDRDNPQNEKWSNEDLRKYFY